MLRAIVLVILLSIFTVDDSLLCAQDHQDRVAQVEYRVVSGSKAALRIVKFFRVPSESTVFTFRLNMMPMNLRI